MVFWSQQPTAPQPSLEAEEWRPCRPPLIQRSPLRVSSSIQADGANIRSMTSGHDPSEPSPLPSKATFEAKARLTDCIHSDTLQLMNRFERSEEFVIWLERLADKKGKARVLSRLDSAALGNFGDYEPVGEGVSEMRVHFGPGYRLYYTRRESVVYLLLIGGDKSSQARDIRRAKEMAIELKKSDAQKQKLEEHAHSKRKARKK
jgi:putative addiction module killer protein